MDYRSGAYIINRRGRGRRGNSNGGGPRRHGAAALIAVLLFLSIGICLLVVFLPKITATVSSAPSQTTKPFFLLVSGESDDITEAIAFATDGTSRGGAGYLYNDGKFKVVAAAYESEADVKALVSVNAGSSYFRIDIAYDGGAADAEAIRYATGEWFRTLYNAASELDRGNITEAAADNAARSACRALAAYARKASDEDVKYALECAAEYEPTDGGTRSLLAYIRFVTVRGIISLSYL